MNVGIICVCLPSLRLMLIRTFPRVFNTVYGYNSDHSAGSSHWSEAKRARRRTGPPRAPPALENDEVQLVSIDADAAAPKASRL